MLKQAHGLLMDKQRGMPVNWETFVDSCKEQYIQYIIQQWAVCYKKINDHREKQQEVKERPDEDSKTVMQAYYDEFIKDTITDVLQDTKRGLQTFILQILCAGWDIHLQQQVKEQEWQKKMEEEQRGKS
jgi:hypothetical protein